ncbi:MAG: RNA-binding protein [Geminicoccaceae bacterium]|jgi:RNA recognition motif-containing protein|nr:RNA-binding protein [Geminicoccaceae bacterium]HRY25531.1 RNA-binding protein [Geminicoccaceae bacterium]
MSSKIFVANFPFSTTSEDLQDLFGQHGEVVSAKVATDRETGRSRGFGFVEMATPAAAGAAIQQLNGYDMGGRPLAVRVAEDRGGAGGGGFGGRGGPGGGRGPGGPGGGPRRDNLGRPPRRPY